MTIETQNQYSDMLSENTFLNLSSAGFRFEKDIEDMLGHRPSWYFKIMWAGVSPILLVVIFVFYIVNYIRGGTPTYQAWNKELVRDPGEPLSCAPVEMMLNHLLCPQGRSVVTDYPLFGQVFIGLLIVSSVSCVPLTALYVFCSKKCHQRRQQTPPD